MDSSVTTANFRVLFISGSEGDTRRYRCSHQQEQLELQEISTDFCTLHDLRLLQDVLDLTRRRGKITLFETDDLIFEPALCNMTATTTA